MEGLPTLITDLTLILLSAGVVTLLFKRLKQPLVLGYIVAGFLASPHMPYTPSVGDMNNISTWADIGVIFLMFTLGLEFSFKKILKMGGGPIIAACTIIFCMIALGSGVGRLFGWSSMDCLFLGGMLAMSSTTIIYKAFDDLKLRQQRFAGQVLSVLILEDILGILLMVILSTVAVSRHFEGVELIDSLLQLLFILILWFLVGVFLVPLFLRKNRRWIGKETLLVVSLGLCFGMVVLAESMGYSAAFGAFMMGSILSETIEAETITKLVNPVKDLFGAVFFVSVGMLVDPSILIAYWLPILVLTLTILIGQAIFGTSGFLLSGQPLKVSIQCGFSMAQIGEFAFIIASLGLALHVTSSFLYPIVVAVSVITTFLTPYMIRLATPVNQRIEKKLPEHVKQLLNYLTRDVPTGVPPTAWRKLLIALTKQVVSYSILCVAVIILSLGFLLPFCRNMFTHWYGNALCGILTIICISPFLRAIVMRKNHSEEFRQLWKEKAANRFPLLFTIVVRFVLACCFVFYIINFLSPYSSLLHAGLAFLLVVGMLLSRYLKRRSILLERIFLQNLRSRDLQAEVHGKVKPLYTNHLLSRDIHLADLEIPDNSCWAGLSLRELDFGHKEGVMIASILRGGRRINIPGPDTILFPGDRIQVIGNDEQLRTFAHKMGEETYQEDTAIESREMTIQCLFISSESPFCNKKVSESGIRDRYHCMIVGFEEGKETLGLPYADRSFLEGDVVWLVGERSALYQLIPTASS